MIAAVEVFAAEQSNVMLKFLATAWCWIGKNDKQILVCFAFIGGLYALLEYWSHQRGEKEQEVARYVQLRGAGHIAMARSKLEVFMNGPEVSKLKKETYGEFFESLITNPDIVGAALVELGFFDSLSICVESDSCSKQLACKYFFLDAEGFLQNFRPLLLKLQVRDILDTDSTVYLRKFAHHQCSVNMRQYCSSRLIKYQSLDCKAFKPPKYV